jgi:hypothetical protein
MPKSGLFPQEAMATGKLPAFCFIRATHIEAAASHSYTIIPPQSPNMTESRARQGKADLFHSAFLLATTTSHQFIIF